MIEYTEETKELRKLYGYWGEHPIYPIDDWKCEVTNDYTRRGYWEWVLSKIEQEHDE